MAIAGQRGAGLLAVTALGHMSRGCHKRLLLQGWTQAIGQRSFAAKAGEFTTRTTGLPKTKDWRLFIQWKGSDISPWHDIPLSATPGLYHMVTEIPAGTNAKMEIATDEAKNPIKQDIKHGALRHLSHGNTLCNYGALPQTWEDPNRQCGGPENLPGDNDPLDVIELGCESLPCGTVSQIKMVGALGLIDEGECDWKMLAIRTDDPQADVINDIDDVERERPGLIGQLREWYRVYKVADGQGENSYAFGGRALDKAMAEKVVQECHSHWLDLKEGKVPTNGLSLL